jgi:hypothetical protein
MFKILIGSFFTIFSIFLLDISVTRDTFVHLLRLKLSLSRTRSSALTLASISASCRFPFFSFYDTVQTFPKTQSSTLGQSGALPSSAVLKPWSENYLGSLLKIQIFLAPPPGDAEVWVQKSAS